ncbi:hypothetical protein BSKO_08471 [Bryopsis sp. KO-2023]|nr:hypothetical protein BSKO_08471 [Bryopsis sp. KO-2023]
MGSFTLLYVTACLALLLHSSTAVCLKKKPKKDFDKLLDACETKGRAAGNIAFRAACLELTSKCPVPKLIAKVAAERLNPEDLFDGVVERTCRKLFVLECKNRATAKALDTEPDCALLLRKGPRVPVEKCEDADDALSIFNKSLTSICSEEEKATRGAGFRNTEDGEEEEDPCKCSKDGLSDCVDTGSKGCKRHLKKFGDLDRFCYVEGGAACAEGTASESFPGAFWRLC